MIARGFKPVAWVAAVGAAALGCYMLSLRVAAERAELTGSSARIVAASQQIRSLQTELGTRGRLQQLEQWNDEVLALSAPVAGQFVEGQRQPRPLRHAPAADRSGGRGPVASAEAPAPAPPPRRRARAAAAPSPRRRRRRWCAAPARRCRRLRPPPRRPSRSPPRTAAAEPRARPAVPHGPRRAVRRSARRRRATEPRRPPRPGPRRAPAGRRPAQPARPRRSPAPSAGLLDERTMRDLGAAARAERGGGTRN